MQVRMPTHELFAVLGNSKRLAILSHLIERNDAVRQSELLELAEFRGLHQSTVSGHLRELASQGLVVKSDGRRGLFAASMPRLSSQLIESAAAIQEEFFGARAQSAAEVRRRLRKADMARFPRRAA